MSSRFHRSSILAIVLLSAALAAAQAAPPQPMTVIRPVANMYSAPTADADVVSQAIYASPVTVLETKDGWVKVRTPDDYTGWMENAALLRPNPQAESRKLVRVTSLFANVYRERDVTLHAPLITVPFETQLELISTIDARWLEVRLPDGRTGFLQSGDITQDTKPLTIAEDIALAKRFLGLPYFWGGTSSFGYDCSGFMQMLIRRRGVIMPRDADLQAAWSGSAAVDRDKLQPGDLLYFGSSPDKITHTGMYIGDNQFINATTYQQPVVRLDSLADPHWTQLLVATRRLK